MPHGLVRGLSIGRSTSAWGMGRAAQSNGCLCGSRQAATRRHRDVARAGRDESPAGPGPRPGGHGDRPAWAGSLAPTWIHRVGVLKPCIHLVRAVQAHLVHLAAQLHEIAACRMYSFLTMPGYQEGTHDGRRSHMDQSLEDRFASAPTRSGPPMVARTASRSALGLRPSGQSYQPRPSPTPASTKEAPVASSARSAIKNVRLRRADDEQGERRQVGPQKVPRGRPSLGVGDGAASRSKVGRKRRTYTHLPFAPRDADHIR